MTKPKMNLLVITGDALAITVAIQGTSRAKIYQEIGLSSLKSRKCINV